MYCSAATASHPHPLPSWLLPTCCHCTHHHLCSNDHLLKLNMMINFIGMRDLVLRPITLFNNNGCTMKLNMDGAHRRRAVHRRRARSRRAVHRQSRRVLAVHWPRSRHAVHRPVHRHRGRAHWPWCKTRIKLIPRGKHTKNRTTAQVHFPMRPKRTLMAAK